jgi:ribosomal protein S18 acetylase RimI-like enzyme
MITLERISAQNAFVFKAVRLRALQDTPSAFGSTYARESQFSDAEWIKRAGNMNGERSIGFIAMDAGTACGIAGCFLDQDDATRAHLISMWTGPAHRQRGVGRLLVNEIMKWARHRGVHALRLMVVCNNESAIKFYERLGFARTGRTEAYPNDPALIEYEMSRPID